MTLAPTTPSPVIANGSNLSALLYWAETIQDSDLIPGVYRRKPASMVVAAMLGEGMRLPWIQSLYRIHVIDGKPSASAELIASNVRAAGHKLRVETVMNPPAARAVIVRKDDPDFEFVAVWTMERAQRAGLANKTNWQKDPLAMLRSRATTEVARMACPDALYGVIYAPDELGGPEEPGGPETGAGERLAASAPATEAEPAPSNAWAHAGSLTPADFVPDDATTTTPERIAESVEELHSAQPTEPPPPEEPQLPETDKAERPITDGQQRMMFKLFNRLSAFNAHPAHSKEGRALRMVWINNTLGRDASNYLTTSNDLTVSDAGRIIDRLEALAARADAQEPPPEVDGP